MCDQSANRAPARLLLVAGADPTHWFALRNALEGIWAIAFAVDLRGMLEVVVREHPALLVLSSDLLDATVPHALTRVRELSARLPVAVLGSPGPSAGPTLEAVSFLPGRFDAGQLAGAVRELLAGSAAAAGAPPTGCTGTDAVVDAVANADGRLRDVGGPTLVIGNSPAMRKAVDTIDRVAHADVNVLLFGETGCGKELLARRLHAASARAAGPFRAVCSPAVPRELFESILFGHERGSFTGAASRTAGAFGQAEGGTLFLDEVSSLAYECQPKLLRAIQEREIERVGGCAPTTCDVRIVAATNACLLSAVSAGSFREDLYHRLSVVTVYIPPLRERPDDIPILADHFVRKYAQQFRRPVPAVSGDAMRELKQHRWSGNARELENKVQKALLLSSGDELTTQDFFETGPDWEPLAGVRFGSCSYTMAEIERAYAAQVLAHANGNQSRAAEILGIDRKTLRAKLRLPTPDLTAINGGNERAS